MGDILVSMKRLSFIVCGVCALVRPALTDAAPPPETVSLDQAHEFHFIYLNSLMLIDPGLPEDYFLNDAENVRRIISDIDTQSSAVRNLGLKDIAGADDYDAQRFERFAIPEIFRYKVKYSIDASTPTLRRFLKNNPKHYPAVESVTGSGIFVEVGPDAAADSRLSVTLEDIAGRLRGGEPFNIVAKDYYESAGVNSIGRFGRATRGQMDDARFDAFLNAEPGAPFFGPVKLPDGYLLGKLDEKMTSGSDLFDYYSRWLPMDYRREMAKQLIETFTGEQMRRISPRVFAYDAASAMGDRQTAYEAGGTSVTFGEAGRRLPQYAGNKKEARFWDAIALKALNDDLILMSTATQEMRRTPEFRFFADAHRNAYLVQLHAKKIMADAGEPDEQALRAYYEAHKKDSYSQAGLVRLLTVTLRRGAAAQTSSPADARLRQQADFAAMNKARETFLADQTTAALDRLRASLPGLSYRVDKQPVAADTLGRVFEMAVAGKQPGDISQVLVEPQAYHFVKVVSVEPQPPAPFEAVRDRVKSGLLETRHREIMKQLRQ